MKSLIPTFVTGSSKVTLNVKSSAFVKKLLESAPSPRPPSPFPTGSLVTVASGSSTSILTTSSSAIVFGLVAALVTVTLTFAIPSMFPAVKTRSSEV